MLVLKRIGGIMSDQLCQADSGIIAIHNNTGKKITYLMQKRRSFFMMIHFRFLAKYKTKNKMSQ